MSDRRENVRLQAPVVVMTAGGLPATLVVNALLRRFVNVHVLVEEPERKGEILVRRARRFGWWQSLGQMATMAAAKALRRVSATRVDEIVASTGLSGEIDGAARVRLIGDVNSASCQAAISEIAPAAVLLVSTRLLARRTIETVTVPLLNLHAGINPAYRGQMGGYWSLAEGDRENFGATLHLVDAGTDTGATLADVRATPSRSDNISTYPLLLTASVLPQAVEAMEDAVAGRLVPRPPAGRSALRFPPPLWTWLRHGLMRGIW